MTDTPPTPQNDDLPAVEVVSESKRSLSLVWIIPLVAAVIGGWLVVKTILEQGPTITIQFENAYGLEAGKTHIKYKDFNVGLVNDIVLSEDRNHFIVTAQLVKEAKPWLVEDTKFWVVRPRFSGGQVSGIGTLLSGSYIGIDPGKSSKEQLKHT
ncbi:MAG TPA: MlaD family protein, partial [Methylophilaceae bacterium]|nr:MlaD family protein [Methylophilaceae bacterium]